MTTVGAYEAKTHLPKLLNRVAKGEKITITKHGVPVAVLQQPDLAKKPSPQAVITKLRKFRKNHTLNGLSLKEMIKAGRR
ncbi:MAG: type II toxin-antitoxin system prevent-host-death family antitoxin [Planctomycetes bacterium]|nr:type II toxin-antitoxin system prevent-host-death family antitoxin [Planctomycetota bacterium]